MCYLKYREKNLFKIIYLKSQITKKNTNNSAVKKSKLKNIYRTKEIIVKL